MLNEKILKELQSRQGTVVETPMGTYRIGKVTERGSVLLHSASTQDTSTLLVDLHQAPELGLV